MLKKIITLIIIIGFMAGCSKDRLVIAPKNQTLETNFYKTPEELRAALIAAYDPISWVFYYGSSTWVTLNVASDDANAGGTPGGQDLLQYQNADKYTLIPSTTNGSESLWRKYYAGIYRANIVLEKAKADNDSMVEIRAEAKFLRAYYYFDLVRFFGDVVLLDHTVTTEYSLSRTPANKIYEFIVKDLTEAIPDLPDKNELSSDQLYRATKSAAQALLGKVYLFMSSPVNNYGNYYQNAADLFGTIIHSGIYNLFADYDMNFDAHHKHGIESLFEIQYTDAFQSTFNYDANTGYSFDESSVDFKLCGIRGWSQGPDISVVNLIDGWGFVKPTHELADAYIAENDLIRLNYNIYLADPTPGYNSAFNFPLSNYGTWDRTVTGEDASADYEGFFRRKYRGDANQETGNTWFTNMVVIRYADVLLMMAECIVNGAVDTKNSNNAAYYINKVRTRVSLPSITTTTMEDIKNERRLEFAFEMIRYWDLLRWGDADNVFTSYKPGKGYQWDPIKKGLWPIPLTEIGRTGGSLTQNSGYKNE